MAPQNEGQNSEMPIDAGREEINALNARIRVVEERINDMRKRFKFLEENMIAYHKKNLKDAKDQQQQTYDVRRGLKILEGKMLVILKELQLAATKQDVTTLRKYIELWNPLKFITEETLQKRIDERIGKKQDDDENSGNV
ncbi:hypothetical protein HY483_03920 [Candidatus Woesearchaeota archaeon]|nr:hypothetical protein [Candidatus Woesearchaeota archaeon]